MAGNSVKIIKEEPNCEEFIKEEQDFSDGLDQESHMLENEHGIFCDPIVEKAEDTGESFAAIKLESEEPDVKPLYEIILPQEDDISSLECYSSDPLAVKLEDTPKPSVPVEDQLHQEGELEVGEVLNNANQNKKNYRCESCEYSSNKKNKVKMHQLMHSDEKPFECSVCEFRCKRKADLKSHISSHSIEKPFKCSVCEFRCKQKRDLKSHMSVHSIEKPFMCSLCDYTCKRKWDLKRHVIGHSIEEPFKSSVRDCRYKQKDDLKSHMTSHPNEKPFKCLVCDYRSNRNSNIKKHMKIHSN